MSQNNLSGRILSNFDSSIYNVERSIAFRIGSVTAGNWSDFHFMKQHSDGSWSQKLVALSNYHYLISQTPDTINWNELLSVYGQQYNTSYDSAIVYIAIYNDI